MATGVLKTGYVEEAVLSKSIAGAVDVTLTADEAAAGAFILTGAITANINLIIPLGNPRRFQVTNRSTGNFSTTVKGASGNGIAVGGNGGNKTALLYWDGTNVIRVSADA
jgi:hypothetical protein